MLCHRARCEAVPGSTRVLSSVAVEALLDL